MNYFDPLRLAVAPIWLGWLIAFGATSASIEDGGRAVTVAPKRGAVVVGSSSVMGTFGKIIAADLERNGYRVTRKGIVGAGLARPDFLDMRKLVESMPIDETTATVFVYLGVNDGQSIWLRASDRAQPNERWLPWDDWRWPIVYLRRAQGLYDSICRRGAKRAIVLLPVDVVNPRLERRLKRIRELQRTAAQRTSCATAISTAAENRRFFIRGEPTRRRDGFHMTEVGARLAWERVKRRAWLNPASRGRWVQ